ncbi:putative transcription factor TFIIIB complex subunit Brf1 [Aspergillus steynii IBT 23096]|uniref:B-related factor 1 n=1 Tax=Aspergillus steynii IBT 23096 TaxID=1392250 RepID=A0A2I2GJR5_9EURO|nr:putative transcription factor TFIIIB complex subunit Brf1 [Aspergillus steynii IBT 23096]PLB53109.1 putative transcription factor TFIIIB complex subunit Brf1 [Aspergillus steynii IBT 23096]
MSGPRPGMRPPIPPRNNPRATPVGRLASLKPPGSTAIKRPQSIARPQPARPTTHPKTSTCPNPGCPAPHIVEDDGQKVCSGCGTVISEANIVSEVTFGETSSGAAVVQGTFVGEDQSHVRSFGPGFQGGSGMESREITEQNGNRYISQLSRALMIPESAMKAAGQVFKLAVGLNFIQGRRTKTVAAVCLYIACRRQDGNTVMLIDFADVLMINVFKLGRTYKSLLDELRLGGNVFLMNPIDPESLIYRFAKQLEFGNATMQVAGEAVRIVQRMNRDWMTTGRRPAGICGAALILAARMNNFRRTVREVVYVVKVTEITISQRLNEFSSTESGELTVDQFRSVQLENAHDPPSFTRAREGRKPSRSVKKKAPETAAEIEGEQDADVTGTRQPNRVDADGFAIPSIPIDPALFEADNRRRPSTVSATSEELSETDPESTQATSGHRKGSRKPELPQPTPDQLASEEALEDEMTALLAKGSNMTENPANAGDQSQQPSKNVSESAEIDESEFESDPEVSNCLLSPMEVEIKERIWVHENKDYLRTQQAKALKRALAESDSRPGMHKPRKRRKGRLGDVTYLEGEGEDGDGRSTRASTPAEATRRMLERRGFSKKINYRLLESLFGEEGGEDAAKAKAESMSRSQSYNQGVFSGIVGNENFLDVVNHPSAVLVGFIVSIYNLGCCAGALVAFLTSDPLGFRRIMWQAMAWVMVGAALQASSFSTAQLLVARFVTGIGVGIMTTVVPVYQSELCEARKRGMFVCSQALFVGVGIVLSYWFDYGMSYVDGPMSWRLPIACQGIFVAVIAGMVLGLPENPRWLYRKGKGAQGFQVLCDFYDCNLDDPKVIKESQGIQRAIELDALRGEYKWSQLFKKDELRTGRRVLLAYGLQFMNQMCGVNMIVSYVTSIFETNIGLDKKTSLLMGGVIQFMFIIGSFYPTFFADRLGRRKPMLWGSFGLFFCMMMISILLSFKGTIIQKETASASMTFFFLFMLTFGASINCIPWVYGPELLPLHVRAKGTAISIAANWLWNFFISMISPTLIQDLAWKGYLIFMCFNLIFVPIIYFFYPETATLSLEQIDTLFVTKRAALPSPDEEHFPCPYSSADGSSSSPTSAAASEPSPVETARGDAITVVDSGGEGEGNVRIKPVASSEKSG